MKEKRNTLQPGCDCNRFRTGQDMFFDNPGDTVSKPRLLLHSCCGPCSSAVIERLYPDFDLTVFFYNPCITNRAEYERRKAAQIQLINAMNLEICPGGNTIKFVEGDYEPEAYLSIVKGLEGAPEGGERCTLCFEMRLAKTAAYASASGYPLYATTLTVSPHKNYALITEIGKRYAAEYGIEYLDRDFKKKAGFQRSVQLSKQYGLYRQDYCGCDFSKRD